MCTTCGCGSSHKHEHEHEHSHDQARIIEVEQNIFSKNNRYAALNRATLLRYKIAAFNLVSSPGSGKTSLLTQTIKALQTKQTISVIEGDQQTDNDAKRVRDAGAQAIQINTGKGCHLDAHAVGHALGQLPLKSSNFVFIENVGNLVCPAAFDLGEYAKVVTLSVTEGDDKPLKYPDMFHAADLMIINKIDLLPYVDFNTDRCISYAKQVNPKINVIQLSATKQNNFTEWVDWLKYGVKA